MSQSEEIRATLVYHRRNRAQAELAESFGVCQSSISRAISRWTPRLIEALEDFIPTMEDLDPSQTLIVVQIVCGGYEVCEGLDDTDRPPAVGPADRGLADPE